MLIPHVARPLRSQNALTWFIGGSVRVKDVGQTLHVGGKTSGVQVYIYSVLSHAACNAAEIIIT